MAWLLALPILMLAVIVFMRWYRRHLTALSGPWISQ